MTNFKDLKKGAILSESQYYTVEKVVGNQAELKTDQGENIVVSEDYVKTLLVSADQYTSEKKINKTEAAQMFVANPSIVLTVSYNKKVDEKQVKKDIYDLYPNKGKFISEADFKKKVDSAIKGIVEGEERVMKGRHWGELNEFGRVQFIDMEIERKPGNFDNRQRQVDPRTINWLIIKGIKYLVK